MSVESFDPKQQAVTVTPAALAHFRRQLGGQQGKAVRSAGDTRPGQRLTARLHDGTLAVEVVKDEPHTLSLLD